MAEGGREDDTDLTRPMDPDATVPSGPAMDDHDRTLDATPATQGGVDLSAAATPSDVPEIPDLAIEEELGRGGMGVVYRGRQTYIDRAVAVKVLLVRGTPSEAQFLKRFQREAKLLAKFDHPHIVKCYQAGVTTAGSPYLVMEFVDGCTLRQQIDREGPLDERRALLVARDVAAALGHAQEAGIIHRDVKPENVLLQAGADGDLPFVVKLADLGLARPGQRTDDASGMLTAEGMVLGTPATMAPEQFDDPDDIDFRCDIYGLGCVLHHALSGSPAFMGKTLSQLLKNKVTQAIPDTAAASGCGKGVAELTAWCLQPEREQRPGSYEELIARIDQLLAGLGSGATKPVPAPSTTAVTPPGPRKAPVFQLGLVAVAVVVLGGSAVALLNLDPPPPVPAPGQTDQPADPPPADPPSQPVDEPADPPPLPVAAPDPRSFSFGDGRSLLGEDFDTRLEGWNQQPAGRWGSHEEIAGAIFGAAFGRDQVATLSRELPPPPWRLTVRLSPVDAPGQPPMREAGLWLRAGDGRAVGVAVQAISAAVQMAVLRERAEADGTTVTVGKPHGLSPDPAGYELTLTAAGDRVVAAVGDTELGEFELAELAGGALKVEGGGVVVHALTLAEPVE